MFTVAVSLLPGDQVQRGLDGAVIADIFWALADNDIGLEHLSVRALSAGVDLIIFVRASNSLLAERAARRLGNRVVTNAPILRGWMVADCVLIDP